MPPSSSSKKRKWSRQQLLRSLEILGSVTTAPLPPTLPPSPPASRSSSPAPGFKRKSFSAPEIDSAKRPRTASTSERHSVLAAQSQSSQHLRVPNSFHNTSSTVRLDPSEDGEITSDSGAGPISRAEPAVDSSAAARSSSVPVRRPRRGRVTPRYLENLHEFYHNAGRMLKYSGDARFWSTYPPSHKEYRPLPDPPPPNSTYYKHGGLIARLELVDALVCFTYSLWNQDCARRHCSRQTWSTIDGFLVWCKAKWQSEECNNDAEKAFLGLIFMIEAFIQQRILIYNGRTLERDVEKLMENARTRVAGAAAEAAANPTTQGGLLTSKAVTPVMLPSPASLPPSANSTPINRDGDTPNTSGGRSASSSTSTPPQLLSGLTVAKLPSALLPSQYRVPVPSHVAAAIEAVTIPIAPILAYELKVQANAVSAAVFAMTHAQTLLNLPIVSRFFPRTFARMVYSALGPQEEHEPDIEDEEGELFWPGQSSTGEGLGWVCLMGKAMIKEFGKAYAYKGLDGVVPKPRAQGEAAYSVSREPSLAPQGATPQGHISPPSR